MSVTAITLRYIFALSLHDLTLEKCTAFLLPYRSRLMETVIASYGYRSLLMGNAIAFYSYGCDNMTKAITCNAVTF